MSAAEAFSGGRDDGRRAGGAGARVVTRRMSLERILKRIAHRRCGLTLDVAHLQPAAALDVIGDELAVLAALETCVVERLSEADDRDVAEALR